MPRQIAFKNAGGLASVLKLAVKSGGSGKFGGKAKDIAMCRHGVPSLRCDDCGEMMPTHPGAPSHVCGAGLLTCATPRGAA